MNTIARPRLFVGSSSESIEIAYAVQENLDRDCETTVWTQNVFALSNSALESLLDVLDDFDFAMLIFTPDDVTRIRGEEVQTPRDNLVFELGLFVARLGRERVFLIVPRGAEQLHLPTDLLGVTPAAYEPRRQDGNMVAALGPACNIVAIGYPMQDRYVYLASVGLLLVIWDCVAGAAQRFASLRLALERSRRVAWALAVLYVGLLGARLHQHFCNRRIGWIKLDCQFHQFDCIIGQHHPFIECR